MLQCSESTVRNQLLRGRKLLKTKKQNNAHGRPAYFLAAALAGSLLVTTGVYAVRFSGLRDMDAGRGETWDLSGIEPGAEDLNAEDVPVKEADFISLGAIEGSAEYQACTEWRTFLEGYDADGAILAEIGNNIAGFGEYELVYNCYTQEMADKVDEICGKYGISRLAGFQLADGYEDLCGRAGIGDIYSSDPNVTWEFYGGYSYEGGTFHMDGRAVLASSRCTTDYQLMRTVRGCFNPLILNIGEREEYREWNYMTESGEIVLLAVSDMKALIVVERDHSIIVVNVLGDLLEKTFEVSDEALEELADAFDFLEIP